MTTAWLADDAQKAFRDFHETVKPDDNINEATTRLLFIDRILFDVLKWDRNEWHCRFCRMTLRRLSQTRWPIVDRQIHIASRVARGSPSARSLSHPRCEVLSGH
jgi:hypothetical protein